MNKEKRGKMCFCNILEDLNVKYSGIIIFVGIFSFNPQLYFYEYEMKWNEKPIVPWRAKASSFEGQLNVYACDELFRMVVQ